MDTLSNSGNLDTLSNSGTVCVANTLSAYGRPVARRPPPLKMPLKMKMIYEVPDDMIEWHGILLPIEDIQSPVTPSHWTVRVNNPNIQQYFSMAITILSSARVNGVRWGDMQQVEFLPNVYLGSYYDIYNFDHSVRVSVLDDFSLYNMLLETHDDFTRLAKLEVNAKDDGDTDIMSHFAKVRDFLDSQPEDSIKFIHCVAGMNRSATLATAYYMYKTGTKLIQALQYMVTLRPIILRNENFLKQLVIWAYDNELIYLTNHL